MKQRPEVKVTVNDAEWWVRTSAEAGMLIRARRSRPHCEIWLNAPDESALCLLINGEVGWLMYLREEGDSGFSSRNPLYDGPDDSVIEYHLANGQIDEYPAAWALPFEELVRAAGHFVETYAMAPFVRWHED
jgi:hypothetical protein